MDVKVIIFLQLINKSKLRNGSKTIEPKFFFGCTAPLKETSIYIFIKDKCSARVNHSIDNSKLNLTF